MSYPKRNKRKPSSPEMQGPTSQRPQSLFQRLSSGFSSMISSLPRRKSTPKHDSTQRPETAPTLYRRVTQGKVTSGPRLPDSEQELIREIEIPTLSDPDRPCPYDPNSYHSSSSIEQSRCDFCGLRPPKPKSGLPPSSRPCSDCQSKSPFSHIAFGRKPSHDESRKSLAVQSNLSRLRENSSSPEEGPRLVLAAVVAKRIGIPPRRASLPFSRLPAASTLSPTHNSHGPQPARQSPVIIGIAVTKSDIGDDGDIGVRSTSPKLHHIHGLPNAKNYPYVHKHEVKKHLDTLHAGSPSPLEQRVDRSTAESSSMVVADYSETVFYGRPISSASAKRSDARRSLFPSQPQSATLMFQRVEVTGSVVSGNARRERPIPLNLELESSEVYRRHSPQVRNQVGHPRPPNAVPQTPESESTASSLDTRATPNVGGKRLELKGGSQSGVSRLRGGSGEKRAPDSSLGLKSKMWLLAGSCQFHSSDTDSDANLPPARTPNPARLARASQRPCRRVPLPSNVSRGSYGTPQDRDVVKTLRNTSAAASVKTKSSHLAIVSKTHSHKNSLPSRIPFRQCFPFFRRCAGSPVLQSTISRTASFTPPIPHLRGGAGPSSALLETDRLPPTLYWLAGGTGRRPITVASWKRQMPKQRVGGLLGMAMYGGKADAEYVKGGAEGEQGTAAAESSTVFVKEGASSVKLVKNSSESVKRSTSSSSVRSARDKAPETVLEDATPQD